MAKRDLLSIDDLTRADVELILDTAESFLPILERDIKKVPTLRGRTIINMFYESSTRTLTSFELAAKRLSADTMNVQAAGSAVDKGESLKDTILTLSAYQPDIIVMRHPQIGACRLVSRYTAGQRHQRRRRQVPAPVAVPARPVHPAPGAGPRPRRSQGLDRRRHPAQPRGAQRHRGLPAAGHGRHRRRAAAAHPARRRDARRQGRVRPGRARRGRRRLPAAHADGAHAGGSQLHPLAARVLDALRHDPGAAAARAEGHAPRPDQPRHRDQPRDRRPPRHAHPRAGRERPGRAHGDPLPHDRRLRRTTATRGERHERSASGASRGGRRPAHPRRARRRPAWPGSTRSSTSSSARAASPRSARVSRRPPGCASSTPPASCCCRVSSTCTRTCARPGARTKKTSTTASAAAAAGGYVAVFGMANTDPVVDSAPLLEGLARQAAAEARVPTGFFAAVSRGLEGEQLTEMHELAAGRRRGLQRRRQAARHGAAPAPRAAVRQGHRPLRRRPRRRTTR